MRKKGENSVKFAGKSWDSTRQKRWFHALVSKVKPSDT
jgi:hypothetical protein